MEFDRRANTDSSIPTSSMADIAFLLIIFFMVTSVFSATKGLELKLPADEERADPQPEPAVFIQVHADRIHVDCQLMDADDILPYLEPKLTRNPNKPVILYTDPDAEYQDMITVYDVLAETRSEDSQWPFVIMNISIPTETEIEEYIELFGANPLENWCDK